MKIRLRNSGFVIGGIELSSPKAAINIYYIAAFNKAIMRPHNVLPTHAAFAIIRSGDLSD